MEEIKINHPFWKTLLLAIGCLEIFAIMIQFTGDLSTYTTQGLLFVSLYIFCFGLAGLYLSFVLIKERLLSLPFMRISEDGLLIVNRLLREKAIKLSDMKYLGIRNITDPFMLDINYMPEAKRQN